MFLRIKRLTNRRNRCDSMFGEYIEKPSKNHLDTLPQAVYRYLHL